MNKTIFFKKFFAGVVLTSLPFSLINLNSVNLDKIKDVTGSRRIVVYEEGTTDAERDAILNGIIDKKIKRLKVAVSADVLENVTPVEVSRLLQNAKVKSVDEDAIAQIQSHNNVTTQAQTLPWGIDQIDAELVWPAGNSANPIKVGIIDTGISSSHPDLTSNVKGGVNTIRARKGWNDDNGHGSHVAGIVAALNNTQGVIGGAPQADLYAIKVLNSAGSGYISDVIEGMDWAIKNHMQVINMSLGCDCPSTALSDAVKRVNAAGIVLVAAAGNSGGSVIYPAAYPEAIAVGATDSSNLLASFSSRGPELDIVAPGVSILSTYRGSNYATLSGTSMASPHVTAAAALLLNTPVGIYDENNSGAWDPPEVRAKLQASATDLGDPGMDNLYGAGLVNAYNAVQ